MTKEDAFTPRLGKIRDRGAAGGARLRKRVTTTAKQLSRSGKRSSFTGKRIGRGGASAMQANYAARRYASIRQRRVIIKTHIAKPGKIVGAGVFLKHLNYLQRDGVERDGSGGDLYTREGREVDADAFAARSLKDRHQFRFIVSPEDADKIGDLKKYTRELMEIMERDLGTRLDWVAVDHHNTGRSHTHIVVRGKDSTGKDLIIAPDYIGRGMRNRASVLATEWLGPRRDLEILKQQNREVGQDRFTGIDRQLAELQKRGEISIEPASTTQDRFKRDLQLRRLKYLEDLKLAAPGPQSVWKMQPDWQDALKGMSKRGDIIKAIAAGLEPGQVPDGVRFIDERPTNAAPLVGTVYRHGPSDELRDTRFLLVRDFDGDIWHAEAGTLKDGTLPPRGAIVELKRTAAEPRQSDRTIALIAQQFGGVYSDELHARHDPSASSAYRLAHKRRLEALRRAGVAERLSDGRWQVDEDFLSRVQKYEAARGRVSISARSWLTLEQQVNAKGETWLDKVDESTAAFPALKKAKQERLRHLRESGILGSDQSKLSNRARVQMNASEIQVAKAKLAKETGRRVVSLEEGDKFEGVYERATHLGQGRFAIIAKSKEFALVPWRKQMEPYLGRNMVIEARPNGVSWHLPGLRKKGLSR